MLVRLHGEITEDGQLKVQLPPGFSVGEVEITLYQSPENVEVTPDAETMDEEIRPTWTEEEAHAMIHPTPKTGAEIVAELTAKGVFGSWADLGIEDPVEWIQEQRRKHEERRGIRW